MLVAQKQPGGNYKDHKYITREVTDSEGNTKVLQVANIFVKDAMKSLLSRGYVREIFNWCVAAGDGRGEGGPICCKRKPPGCCVT